MLVVGLVVMKLTVTTKGTHGRTLRLGLYYICTYCISSDYIISFFLLSHLHVTTWLDSVLCAVHPLAQSLWLSIPICFPLRETEVLSRVTAPQLRVTGPISTITKPKTQLHHNGGGTVDFNRHVEVRS
jgi:hypothetical protein